MVALHSLSVNNDIFENVTAYYSTCSSSSVLDANLDLISSLSREMRFTAYDGMYSCSAADITSLTSSLTWTQLQAESAKEKVSCARFHPYWEQLMHNDVCGDMIEGALMLDLASVLSVPLFVIAVSVIHNHTRALQSWRVRPSAFRWRYRGLREDEPLSPERVPTYTETHTHTHHVRKSKLSPDPPERAHIAAQIIQDLAVPRDSSRENELATTSSVPVSTNGNGNDNGKEAERQADTETYMVEPNEP